MTEGTDLIFVMYSCSVHDSFIKAVGQQLGMLLNKKSGKKKAWYNHAMERSLVAGFKTQPLKNICISVSERVFLHDTVYCSHQKCHSNCKLASLVKL